MDVLDVRCVYCCSTLNRIKLHFYLLRAIRDMIQPNLQLKSRARHPSQLLGFYNSDLSESKLMIIRRLYMYVNNLLVVLSALFTGFHKIDWYDRQDSSLIPLNHVDDHTQIAENIFSYPRTAV